MAIHFFICKDQKNQAWVREIGLLYPVSNEQMIEASFLFIQREVLGSPWAGNSRLVLTRGHGQSMSPWHWRSSDLSHLPPTCSLLSSSIQGIFITHFSDAGHCAASWHSTVIYPPVPTLLRETRLTLSPKADWCWWRGPGCVRPKERESTNLSVCLGRVWEAVCKPTRHLQASLI